MLGLAGAALVAGALVAALPAGASASSSTTKTITHNWEMFFSGKTSATEKLSLLEDSSAFATIVRAQAGSALAKSASATVASVKVSGSTASVRYTIDLGGAPALKNQNGEAVKSGGTWKVSAASFCTLLDLEQVKTKACKS